MVKNSRTNHKRHVNVAMKKVKGQEGKGYLRVMLGETSGYSGGSEMTRVTRTCCSLTFWAVAGTTTTSTPDGTPLMGVTSNKKGEKICRVVH